LNFQRTLNLGVSYSDPKSKYICFIDDDARIIGRYNQTTDWVDYLYNRFHEQPDVGGVSPIFTWFDELKTNALSVACLFTSKKVWEIVGGFDNVFGNKEKGTWGYEDVDWSYRAFLRGFKLLGIVGNDFPFYHPDTTFKEKSPEREKSLLKGKELILSKYDLNEINKYVRTVYPFTKEQLENTNGVKLNIGCYWMYIDGFINIDIQDNIGADLVCDMRDVYTHFMPESVDLILVSQALEHITKEDAVNVLKSYYQMLKPGGMLIVEVPDCENIDNKLENGEIDIPTKNVLLYGGDNPYQSHHATYTKDSLTQLFKDSWFKNIFHFDKEFTTNRDMAIRIEGIK
jgi:predicted SAM-dependent methyltransferase